MNGATIESGGAKTVLEFYARDAEGPCGEIESHGI